MKVYKFNLRFSVNAQFWLQKSVYPEKEKGSRPYICNNIVVYRYINLYNFCFKKYTSLHDIGFIISWPSLSFLCYQLDLIWNIQVIIGYVYIVPSCLKTRFSMAYHHLGFCIYFCYYFIITLRFLAEKKTVLGHTISFHLLQLFLLSCDNIKVIYFRLKARSRVTSGLGSQFQLSAIRSDVSGWK